MASREGVRTVAQEWIILAKWLDKDRRFAHPVVMMSPHEVFSSRVRYFVQSMADPNAAALSGLFDLTAARLVRFATTITRNQHDAEDAVQAALVKVSGQPDLLRHCDNPWSYLLRMVRNEALWILRRRKRWSLVANLSDLLTRRSVDELDQEDTYRTIWTALRALPTDQSEVVVLKIWEEMTFAEISQVLEISASTAASRYRYAMEKLARKLQRLDGVEVNHE